MTQDTVADGLNMIMNAKRAGKNSTSITRYSKVLLGVLAIGKIRGYIENYRIENNTLKIEFAKLNACRAIKPRYIVKVKDIDKYIRRFLPAKNMGIIILSTNQGLMTHYTAYEKNLGGSILAYFY